MFKITNYIQNLQMRGTCAWCMEDYYPVLRQDKLLEKLFNVQEEIWTAGTEGILIFH